MKKLIISFLILALVAFTYPQQDDKDLLSLRKTAIEWFETCKSNDGLKLLSYYDLALSLYSTQTKGLDGFNKYWEMYKEMPDYSLTWQIDDVGISKSGEIGYATGPWQQHFIQNDTLSKTSGKYLTIWRKQKEGTWKIIFEKPY